MKNIVVKFGGSSLGSADNIKKVKEIINKYSNIKAIIVSAPGKSENFPTKVTDALILAHEEKDKYIEHMNYVKSVYKTIINELGIYFPIDYELQKIYKIYNKNKSRSYLVSRGEYLSAKILSKYLSIKFIDSKDLIRFSKSGKILSKTYKNIQNAVNNNEKCIIPGFYGATRFGKIKIMCRGGSDITGSIIARALSRCEYVNYTDVDGLYKIHPQISSSDEIIKNIDYENMQFLSYYGANVFHYKCCSIFNNGISLIKNTLNPNSKGTKILPSKRKYCNFALTITQGVQIVFSEKNRKIIKLLKKLKHEKLYSFSRMGDIFYGFRLIEHEYRDIDLIKIKKEVWNYIDILVYSIIGKTDKAISQIKSEKKDCILYFTDDLKTNMVYRLF